MISSDSIDTLTLLLLLLHNCCCNGCRSHSIAVNSVGVVAVRVLRIACVSEHHIACACRKYVACATSWQLLVMDSAFCCDVEKKNTNVDRLDALFGAHITKFRNKLLNAAQSVLCFFATRSKISKYHNANRFDIVCLRANLDTLV